MKDDFGLRCSICHEPILFDLETDKFVHKCKEAEV